MFSFDTPFAFAAADDLQSGIQSGDVVRASRRCSFAHFSRIHRLSSQGKKITPQI
jgi:hypothetical protein